MTKKKMPTEVADIMLVCEKAITAKKGKIAKKAKEEEKKQKEEEKALKKRIAKRKCLLIALRKRLIKACDEGVGNVLILHVPRIKVANKIFCAITIKLNSVTLICQDKNDESFILGWDISCKGLSGYIKSFIEEDTSATSMLLDQAMLNKIRIEVIHE